MPARPTRESHTDFLEVALLRIQLVTGFVLTDNDDWHIDDREHCLQGRSIVMISVSVNVTVPVDLLATLKVVLTDRGDWHIDDREHCLQGRSIVMIVISGNVIVLIRLRCCLGATASMWETLGDNINIFTIFSTANANGIGVWLFFHTENSTRLFDSSILSWSWADSSP